MIPDETSSPKELAVNAPRSRVQRQLDAINDMPKSDRERILDKLLDEHLDDEEEAKNRGELVNSFEYAEEALDRMRNWGKMVGLSSGYIDIDRMTLGFAPGELTIVAGETSQGKTLLCCNIAANMIREKHKVVFVTLEMTKSELLSRFWKILGFKTDDAGVNQMFDASQYLLFQKIERMDWKSIPYLIQRAKEAGAECVFIDHLHYFAREMHDVANELGIITQEFKQAAIKFNLPIVLVSHTRKVERGKSRADLNDLRGSSYIAQDADIVLMVRQDKELTEPHIYVALDKNRNRADLKIGTELIHYRDGIRIKQVLDPRKLDEQSVSYDPSKHSIAQSPTQPSNQNNQKYTIYNNPQPKMPIEAHQSRSKPNVKLDMGNLPF